MIPKEKSDLFLFDIETCPTENWWEMIKPFDPLSIKLGNLKDRDKIREKLDTAKRDYERNAEDKCLLSPLTAEVLYITIQRPNGETQILDSDEITEKEVIYRFWEYVKEDVFTTIPFGLIAGWNIKEFDLPFLIKRSWKHRLQVPEPLIKNGRFCYEMTDLMLHFACGSYEKRRCSLDKASRYLGVGSKPTGKMSGKDFHKFYRSRDKSQRALAKEYALNDLKLIMEIAEITDAAYCHGGHKAVMKRITS